MEQKRARYGQSLGNDAVLAESGRTVIVEGNHYFLDVSFEYLGPSASRAICLGKATRITIPLPPTAAKVLTQPGET